MNRILLLFLSISSFAFGQNHESRKIIIINNSDTTILTADPFSMDSLIEINMKSMYGIESELSNQQKNVRVEVYIDSVIHDTEQPIVINEFPGDTVQMKMGNKRIVVIEKEIEGKKDNRKIIIDEDVSDRDFKDDDSEEEDNEHANWAGIAIGLNCFMNSDGKFAKEPDAPFLVLDYAQSINFQLNAWEKRFPIVKEYVGLTTGLGLQWNRYGIQKNLDILSNSDSIYAVANTTQNFNKNVLRATYLQVPILLDFNTNKVDEKSWHFSLGLVGGVRIASSLKTKWEENGKPIKAKTKDDLNLNSLSANAYAQVGYGNIGLFVQYGLTDVFRLGKGPQLSPIAAGLMFNF